MLDSQTADHDKADVVPTVRCKNCQTPKPKFAQCTTCRPVTKRQQRLSGVARRKAERAEARRQRAAEMAERYEAGATLVEIGDYYGITRERVRQLMTQELGIRAKDGGMTQRATVKRKVRESRRESRHVARWGMSVEERAELRAMDPDYKKTPIHKYTQQRRTARDRGIQWDMTLAEWWSVWEESGKWDERGRGRGSYVMARHGDSGPYAIGNVKIIRFEVNNAEYIRRYWRRVKSGDLPPPVFKKRRESKHGFHLLNVGNSQRFQATGTTPNNMRENAYRFAKRMGWKFQASVTDDSVIVTRLK